METTIPNDLKEQQRDSWNKFYGVWKKWDSLVMNWLKPVGEKLIEAVELRGDDQVLDYPTGTGGSGLTAASHVKKGKLIATDLSEKNHCECKCCDSSSFQL
jgi:ubiquinone/menaquinone biosynthesis C-methylase UbiE